MRQNVVADHYVGRAEVTVYLRYNCEAEKTFESGDTAAAGFGRDVACGFNAEYWNSVLLKKTQQIAVVASDFQDLASAVEVETVYIGCGHRLGVPDEAVGVGREVGVFSE